MGGAQPIDIVHVFGRNTQGYQSGSSIPGTSNAHFRARGHDGARSIAAMVVHAAGGIKDASGVKPKAAPAVRNGQICGMSDGGIGAGEAGGGEPPRRLSGGHCGQRRRQSRAARCRRRRQWRPHRRGGKCNATRRALREARARGPDGGCQAPCQELRHGQSAWRASGARRERQRPEAIGIAVEIGAQRRLERKARPEGIAQIQRTNIRKPIRIQYRHHRHHDQHQRRSHRHHHRRRHRNGVGIAVMVANSNENTDARTMLPEVERRALAMARRRLHAVMLGRSGVAAAERGAAGDARREGGGGGARGDDQKERATPPKRRGPIEAARAMRPPAAPGCRASRPCRPGCR